MIRLFIIICAVAQSCVANAQSIDFNPPPAAAVPSENAFVIVFNDGIQTAEAQAIVEAIQPESFSVAFRSVTVTSQTARALTDEELSVLNSDKDVISIASTPLTEGVNSRPNATSRVLHYQIEFSPWLSVKQVHDILAKFDILSDGSIHKAPNEIEVKLKSASPETVAALEKRSEVKYVAYLAAD